jgi:hypothetical protein
MFALLLLVLHVVLGEIHQIHRQARVHSVRYEWDTILFLGSQSVWFTIP